MFKLLPLAVVLGAVLAAPFAYGEAENKPPRFTGIRATFVQEEFATNYRVSARDPEGRRLTIGFRLAPPPLEPRCTQFSPRRAQTARGRTTRVATWVHGDQHGCDHSKMGPQGHMGTVSVTVSDRVWTCRAVYDGSNTGRSPAPACTRN